MVVDHGLGPSAELLPSLGSKEPSREAGLKLDATVLLPVRLGDIVPNAGAYGLRRVTLFPSYSPNRLRQD